MCQHFTQHIRHRDRLEGDIRNNCVLVRSHCHKFHVCCTLFAIEIRPLFVSEGIRQLNRAVRTEVEENDRIIVLQRSYWLAVFNDDSRQYELIRFTVCIACFYDILCRLKLLAFAVCDGVVCQFHTFPTVVTVHCVVATGNSRNFAQSDLFHRFFHCFDVAWCSVRIHVATIKESMQIKFFDAFFFSALDQSDDMVDVTVHTTVGKQAEKMQSRIIFSRVIVSTDKRFVRQEFAILDSFVDSCQTLVDNSSGTNVCMPYFRITHLAFRKSYSQSGSQHRCMRKIVPITVKVRFLR